jgi:hypothetical protein
VYWNLLKCEFDLNEPSKSQEGWAPSDKRLAVVPVEIPPEYASPDHYRTETTVAVIYQPAAPLGIRQ